MNNYKTLIEKQVTYRDKSILLIYIVLRCILYFIDDVLVRMMDERTSETARNLYGHNGPIYNLSFSPDRNLLLSSSEDTTSKPYIWSVRFVALAQ